MSSGTGAKHLLSTTIRGAGTGNTSYLVACTCGWTHEDLSAMNAYDRATMHELRSTRAPEVE